MTGGRFRVVSGHDLRGRAEYLVVDAEDGDRPVAEFAERGAAEDHAARLNQGPLDWDEQEAWQDEWDEDDRGADVPGDQAGGASGDGPG